MNAAVVTMTWPWYSLLLIQAVDLWPVSLGIGTGFIAATALARGWIRWTAFVAALPFLAVTALAAWSAVGKWQARRETTIFEARIHQVLDRAEVVNGIPLTAGTAVQWRDVDHRHLAIASPPEPITLFGLRVSWIGRTEDGQGWDLLLAQPGTIEGWRCAPISVTVSAAGRLQSCKLASGRSWQGWSFPSGTLLDLSTPDKVGLSVTTDMAAPEIGHALTATGGFDLNADGSLDRFYFQLEDPLVVAGQRLWNTVQWTYGPGTYGQGRRRQAVTVRGTLVSAQDNAGQDVIIHLPGGQVSPAD